MANLRAEVLEMLKCLEEKSESQNYGSDGDSFAIESVLSHSTSLSPGLEVAEDPNLVTWDGDRDPANPRNWSLGSKWAATVIISAFAFISPLSSTMVSPALRQIATEFNISTSVEKSLVLSIFTIAYSFGPFVLAPTSEIYGRVHVVQIANMFYIVWNFACGFAQNKTQMLIFRFLAGIGGSATLGVGGGVLSDVWLPHQRGRGVSVYSLAPVLGPAIGPIAGGFIVEYTTWRWGFWAITIANVIVQGLAFFFLHETYAPRILGKKAARLRVETRNTALHTQWDDPDRTLLKLYARSFYRPWKLLFTQPIIQVLAVYNAYNYGLLYLFISTFPTLWEDEYKQRIGIGGLNFISIAAGNLVASQVCAPCNDAIYKILKRRYGYHEEQEGVPEFRLPLMILGSIITPLGLFWYGWSAQTHAFWLMPNIGVALYAAGSLICYQCIQVYIIDAYTSYAASATAATTFLRSLCAFTFPLFAPYLTKYLGYGWEGTLLGGIAIVLGVPTPFLLWKYGASIRKRSSFCAGTVVHK